MLGSLEAAVQACPVVHLHTIDAVKKVSHRRRRDTALKDELLVQ